MQIRGLKFQIQARSHTFVEIDLEIIIIIIFPLSLIQVGQLSVTSNEYPLLIFSSRNNNKKKNIMWIPASILRKSTSGRNWPVSYPDGPMTA